MILDLNNVRVNRDLYNFGAIFDVYNFRATRDVYSFAEFGCYKTSVRFVICIL